MNIRDFGDVNEKLAKKSEMSPELLDFIAFALSVLVGCIIFIIWG